MAHYFGVGIMPAIEHGQDNILELVIERGDLVGGRIWNFRFPDVPAGRSFHAAFPPPTVRDAQTGDAIQRGLHPTGAGCFKGTLRCIQPKIHAAGDELGPAHAIVFDVDNPDMIFQSSNHFKDATNQGFARLILWMSFAAVNYLDWPDLLD